VSTTSSTMSLARLNLNASIARLSSSGANTGDFLAFLSLRLRPGGFRFRAAAVDPKRDPVRLVSFSG
jgi:hypothetical protein